MPRTPIHREIYGLFFRLPRLGDGSVVIPVVSHRIKFIAFNFMSTSNCNAESSSQRVSGLPISWASSLLAPPARVLTCPMVVCLMRYKKVSFAKLRLLARTSTGILAKVLTALHPQSPASLTLRGVNSIKVQWQSQ